MRKFKVRYYELAVNEKGDTFNEVKEAIVEAENFKIQNEMVIFELDSYKNVALYSNVICVEKVSEQGE